MKLKVGMKVKVKPLCAILNHISCGYDSYTDLAYFNVECMSKFCETIVTISEVHSDRSKYDCRIIDQGREWAFAKEWLEEI